MNNKMNNIIDNLQNIIKDRGATIDKDGKKATFQKGFFVSIYGAEKKQPLENIDFELLKNDLQQKFEYITKHKNNYIGLWIFDGLLYTDISKHIKHKQDALTLGVKNNQKAIFDIEKNQDIYLIKKVYTIYKYNVKNNDFVYCAEFEDLDQVATYTNSTKNSIQHKLNKTIDDVKLLANNYCIIIDNI